VIPTTKKYFLREDFLVDRCPGIVTLEGKQKLVQNRNREMQTPFETFLPFSVLNLKKISRNYREEKMPIYEFKCRKCGSVFESLCFRSSGEDKGACPSCGEQESDKLLSTFSSVSSGSGDSFGSSVSPSCGSHGGFS